MDGSNRDMKFVPAEGIEQVLLAPIKSDRKVAILLAALGHDQRLEGLEVVVAQSVNAQISRYNAKYDLAVAKRKERQAKYYQRRKPVDTVGQDSSTPFYVEERRTGVEERSSTPYYPPESESESESESDYSPQSPPTGGDALRGDADLSRPGSDAAAGPTPKKRPAPPAQMPPAVDVAAPQGLSAGQDSGDVVRCAAADERPGAAADETPDAGPGRRRFQAPTAEQVAAYAAERGMAIDAERFVDFYASKGWMVGRSRMKDWRAAVRNWLRGDFHAASPGLVQAAPPVRDPLDMPPTETAAERVERWAKESREEAVS